MTDPTDLAGVRFQPYDKTALKFKTSVTNVLVPVVVTDENGNHVTGLKKEDFYLQENGKDQKISSLEEIKAANTPLPHPSASTGSEVTNQTYADSAPHRLVIIALDLVNTPFEDQLRARQAMIRYLSESIDPDSLYQLVAIQNNGLRILHDYTQDTNTLIAALKAVRSSFPTTHNVDSQARTSTDAGPTAVRAIPVDPDTGRPEIAAMEEFITGQAEQAYAEMREGAAASSTLAAFQEIAERAGGIPGRKSLIWITGSFPFSIDPGSGSVSEGLSFAAYQHTMQLLQDQLISVYPVDARGLLTISVDASMHLSRKENAQAASLLSDQSNRLRDTLDTMRAFADMTGGRAYVNTNDTRGAIRDAVKDGSAYYMLSYSLDRSDHRPGWRKIAVKVRNYRVRARQGYYATQTTVDPLSTARYDIDNALKSPLDFTGMPLRIVLNPTVINGDKRKVTFAMMVPPKVARVDSEDKNHLHVDIAYAVWTAAGKDAGHKGTSYNLNLNSVQLQQIDINGLSYGDTLELAPGSYRLRLVVRDNLTGQIGSVSAPLELK